MKPEISLTFLGTGTSTGVPVIGCNCKVCISGNPKLTRTRASIHVQTPEFSVLVDSGPDLREQALRENLTCVDAVLYTHAHLDHITGFDELRAFCWGRDKALPMYGSPACLSEVKRVFNWAFLSSNTYSGYVKPDPKEIRSEFYLGDMKVSPVRVEHGSLETHGYRFDYLGLPSVAYLPDVKRIPEQSVPLLRGVDILIIDALHHREHVSHMNLEEALATAEAMQVATVYLTHIGHEMRVSELEGSLPDKVKIAYDGLKLTFPLDNSTSKK